MDRKTKSWINAALLVATLIVNALGATGIINGLSQKEISDRYQTLITPAPSTFSIWSVIYTFLIISIVVLVIKAKDNYYGKVLEEISPLFWVSCALNNVWIVTFSYELIGLSTIFIFAFLIVMVLIVKRLGRIQEKNRFLLPVAFGLYAGWLFIATVVNIAAWLVKVQWARFGISEEIWSIVILLVAVGLTLLVLLDTKNAILPLPIAWAYFGIYNFLGSPEGFDGAYTMLQNIALLGMALLIGLAAIQFYKNKYRIMPKSSESTI